MIRASWIDSREIRDLTEALNLTSGIFVKDVTRSGDQILIEGMQDPLATPISSIVDSLGIPPADVMTNMQSFQSLNPEIIRRRVDQQIPAIDTISYELSGTTLVVSGSAPAAWIDNARTKALMVAGIDSVDTSSVANSDLENIRREVESLSGTRFMFSNGINWAENQETALRNFAQKLAELQSVAARSEYQIQIVIYGTTDSSGTVAANTRLAVRRGIAVSALLSEYGVASSVIRESDVVAADQTATEKR